MLLISFYFIFLLSSYTLYAFHISQSQLRNAKIWKFSHQNQINQIDYHKPSIYALSTTPRSINQYDSNIVSSILKSTAFVASSLLLTTSELQIANAATEEDLSNIKCTILGAGGKTGKLIIERLSRLGATSVPVYREVPTSNPWRDFKNINEPLAADVTKIETLEFAIQGSSVVVFAVSASRKGGKADIVDYLGVENVAKECVRLKIPKLIVISSAAVTKPDSLGFKFTNIFGRIMEYKLKGELALQQIYKNADSSLSFIIVRPGGLLDGNSVGAGKIMINQGKKIHPSIYYNQNLISS